VITVLPSRDHSGTPGVINRAGIAITAVNIGIKIKSLLRKVTRGIFDSITHKHAKRKIINKTERLCAKPTKMMKSTRVMTLTRGSSPCNSPGTREISSVTTIDSSA
jgi:hypothetical protein